MTPTMRQALVAIRFLVVMTVLLGIGYPLLVFAGGRLDSRPADGSLLRDSLGNVVGSALLGQNFSGAQWFHSRPSAAGKGYDPLASGGTNLGPNNPALVDSVTKARAAVAAEDGVPVSAVPADAVTSSASGLDPHISPAYAAIQIARVTAARHLSIGTVTALVSANTTQPLLGFIGEPAVNVLQLNLALSRLG